MTAAWATCTASFPRDKSRSSRTAMTSLYSMLVELRGALLLEPLQLRLDGLEFRTGLVPPVLVVGAGVRRLEAHASFRVLDRPPDRLPPLREFLEPKSDPMVPLLLREELPRAGLRHACEGRVEARHPGVRPAPPSDCEERRGEAQEATRDVRVVDIASVRLRVHPQGVQEEAPEDRDGDRQDDAEGESVEPVVLPVELPFPRIEGVDEEPAGEEEDQDEGGDHPDGRDDRFELVRHRRDPAARVYLKIVRSLPREEKA